MTDKATIKNIKWYDVLPRTNYEFYIFILALICYFGLIVVVQKANMSLERALSAGFFMSTGWLIGQYYGYILKARVIEDK